jgi:hypothetical protein
MPKFRTIDAGMTGHEPLATGTVAAPNRDVTFWVVGKGARFYQDVDKQHRLWRYHLFAEVFLTKDGRLSNLALTLPGGDGTKLIPQLRPTKSELVNAVYKFDNVQFTSEEALNRMFPNGVYTINFDTPSGKVHDRTVTLDAPGRPSPPIVTLLQDGAEVDLGAVDPDKDLLVTWNEWEGAAADPNGIVDDMIFVAAHHCNRDYAIHSGRPFEGTPFLTYRAREFRIASEQLDPGREYTMFVEFAKLIDTNRVEGIVGMATFSTQSYVTFHTTGKPRHLCPQDPVH